MPVGRAVLLIPPQQFPTSCKNAAKSFSCHRSENSPVSPLLATLPKIAVCKSFVCHTSDTPGGLPVVSRLFPSAPQRLCATIISSSFQARRWRLSCPFTSSTSSPPFSALATRHFLLPCRTLDVSNLRKDSSM